MVAAAASAMGGNHCRRFGNDDRGAARPWAGIIAVALAMTIEALLGHLWWWPPLLAVSWAATREWRWTWVLTFQLAIVGSEWAYIGVNALTTWPDRTLLIGLGWIAFPMALAGAGYLNRRHGIGTIT